MKAWVGHGLVDLDDARIPVDDRGLTTGDGCFETMKVVGGRPFTIGRHLARSAARARRWASPSPRMAVARAVDAVLAANGGGVGRDADHGHGGSGPARPRVRGRRAGPLRAHRPARVLPESSSVPVAPWVRNERSPLAGVKATSYGENVVAQRWRPRAAATRRCSATRGELCEGTGVQRLRRRRRRAGHPAARRRLPRRRDPQARLRAVAVARLYRWTPGPRHRGLLHLLGAGHPPRTPRPRSRLESARARRPPQGHWRAMVARTLDPDEAGPAGPAGRYEPAVDRLRRSPARSWCRPDRSARASPHRRSAPPRCAGPHRCREGASSTGSHRRDRRVTRKFVGCPVILVAASAISMPLAMAAPSCRWQPRRAPP